MWYVTHYVSIHSHSCKYHIIAGKFGRGKFGEFGELSAIHQNKLVLKINNLLTDLLIRQTFVCQMLETSQFTKLSHYTAHTLVYMYTHIHTLGVACHNIMSSHLFY